MEQHKTKSKFFKRLKAFGFKNSKAQHLVELVLFFPFLVGIIGLLTEIAYGLNTGLELQAALGRAVGNVSSTNRVVSNSSLTNITKEMQDNTYAILVSRKVPYANTLKVEMLEIDGFYVTIATYDYTYAFKLVNLFFSAVPEKFYFKSVAITNKALFSPNTYAIADSTIANNFSSYHNAWRNELETFISDKVAEYTTAWINQHKSIWNNYVYVIKQRQLAAAQEKENAESETGGTGESGETTETAPTSVQGVYMNIPGVGYMWVPAHWN